MSGYLMTQLAALIDPTTRKLVAPRGNNAEEYLFPATLTAGQVVRFKKSGTNWLTF